MSLPLSVPMSSLAQVVENDTSPMGQGDEEGDPQLRSWPSCLSGPCYTQGEDFSLRVFKKTDGVIPAFCYEHFRRNSFKQYGMGKLCMFSHPVMSLLCGPMVCSLPSSSVLGILQAKILEWVAISLSSRSFLLRERTQVSYIAGNL